MRYQQQRVSKLVGPPSQDDTETGLEDEQEYIPTTSKAPNPPQPPQQNPFQDESDDEIWGPPVKRLKANSTIKSISDLISRGMDIDALVNEPGPGPRRRRKLGTNIMDEIEDYEEVIDLTKELENERAVKQEEQRRPRRRRAANAQPRAPPSHMKDIYEVIVIEDDDE